MDDGVTFKIISAKNIMEEHGYPGLRFMLDAFLDHMRQPIKIDIYTGDVITPAAIEYSYPLMFENSSKAAFSAICRKRNLNEIIPESSNILWCVKNSDVMLKQWNNYRTSSYYVGKLDWQEVVESVYKLAQMLKII